jgi:hypothetical protein
MSQKSHPRVANATEELGPGLLLPSLCKPINRKPIRRTLDHSTITLTYSL